MNQFRSKAIRAVRDLSVLGVLCGCFYLLTLVFAAVDGESDPSNTSPIAALQRSAEVDVVRRDWEAASETFNELIELDPYYGRAYKNRADCFNKLRIRCMQNLDSFQQSGERDPAKERELVEQEKRLSVETIEAFEKSLEFARFRGESYEWLARISSLQSRLDAQDREEYRRKSIEYLKTMIEEKFCTRRGIAVISDFAYVESEPEFKSLCELEDKVVANDPYYQIVRNSYNSGLRFIGF